MDTKDLKIAVAGTGYVGLSIATLLSQHHQVTAVVIVKTCSYIWFTICFIRLFYIFILQLIFCCHSNPFDKSLLGCFSEAILSRVCSLRVVWVHPYIKVCLQLLNGSVYFLSGCNSIELILHGPIESLAYTVCLRTFRFDLGMVDILHCQI